MRTGNGQLARVTTQGYEDEDHDKEDLERMLEAATSTTTFADTR